MRIIARRTLRQFWETHPRRAEAKSALQLWHSTAEGAEWATPAEVKGTQAALIEVDALMEAQPETLGGARLDVLATLIEAYERRHWAIDAPDPVDAIRGHEVIRETRWSRPG
jgi:hypothetical protein